MTWRLALWQAIMDRAKVDTGASGIFELDGTNQLAGFYNVWLPTDQTFPAVTYEVSAANDVDGFAFKSIEIEIRMHVWAKEVPTDGDTDGGTLLAGIVDRINGNWLTRLGNDPPGPTHGFDRWKPTIAGWTTDMMSHQDSIENHEPENGLLHQIESFDLLISKQGA